MAQPIRLIAFYLPQFHPIPENDLWWGKGFTEWTNVTRARPLFKGHYQPHIPADLGFYDLRVPETRAAQAALARQYGIEAFCYWHYWFEGKRLIERPFNEVLQSGEPAFPFCLAWANESWSRRWLGEDKELLMRQTYSEQDDYNHIHWLMNAFADPRYVRVQGRPLFLIYRPRDLPSLRRTAEIFRGECVKRGLPEPFLLGINAHAFNADFQREGLDGTLAFKPELGYLPNFLDDSPKRGKFKRNLKRGILSTRLKIYDYEYAQRVMMAQSRPGQDYPCVFVGWDNSPRRGANGIIIVNQTPQAFGAVLREVVRHARSSAVQDKIVFINAWNEWAEGNHLEPDLKNQHGYLEQIPRALNRAQTNITT